MNWRNANDAAKWLPVLNAAETYNKIPKDLLARMAFEESSFLPEVISGQEPSPAGALGIMQLEPKFFPGAGRNASDDIYTASDYLSALYNRFKDWQLAVAAYNWGPTALGKCLNAGGGFADLPLETRNYVKQIVADVPVPGCLV